MKLVQGDITFPLSDEDAAFLDHRAGEAGAVLIGGANFSASDEDLLKEMDGLANVCYAYALAMLLVRKSVRMQERAFLKLRQEQVSKQ